MGPEDLFRIRHSAQDLACGGEPFASKSKQILETLPDAASVPGAAEFCANHGSYLPQHVLLEGGRTVTVDLDDYVVGHSSRDVAYFIVGLQRVAQKRLGSFHELDGLAEIFLTTYASSCPGEAMARVPFYLAAEYLHRAKRYVALQPVGWRETAEAMLGEALGALSASPYCVKRVQEAPRKSLLRQPATGSH